MKTINSEYIILDSSALIALLDQEKGYEIIVPLLSKAVMSSVNVAEVAKFLIYSRNYSKEEASNTIMGLLHTVIPFDTNLALISAAIINKTSHLGLSLGDRACIALGLNKNYTIYTTDKIWSKLELDCNIICIR